MIYGCWWMVELASVKILHELRCHEVFEDMDDVTRYFLCISVL